MSVFLYKITFFGTAGKHKPTFQIVSKDVLTAIEKAKEMLNDHEKEYEVRWVDTITHVDGIGTV